MLAVLDDAVPAKFPSARSLSSQGALVSSAVRGGEGASHPHSLPLDNPESGDTYTHTNTTKQVSKAFRAPASRGRPPRVIHPF